MMVNSLTHVRRRRALRLAAAAAVAVAALGWTPLGARAASPAIAPTTRLAASTPRAGVPAAPAAPTASTPITMDEAIRIALQQNPTLVQTRNAAALNEAAARQQKLQFLPDLRANASTSQSYSSSGATLGGAAGTLDQSARSLTAGLSSSLTLFDGLKNVASLHSAQLTARASGADVQRAEQTVVFTVASNYLDLVQQSEQLRVQQQNLAAEEAQEKEIDALVRAGTRPISDLYTQQAATAATRAAVVDADNAVQLAKVTLMQTLQLDPRGTFEFQAPAVDTSGAAASFDIDSLLARALAQRADLGAQGTRVAAADQDVKAAKAGRWPTISLTAGYNTAYTSTADASVWNQLGQRQGGSIGIGLSVPLFDRGATSLDAQRARVAADDARLALATQQRQVGLDVRRAYLDYQAAGQKLSAATAQVKAAEQALTATRERYRVGAATLVELTQARAAQVQARSALVSARYALVFQRTMIAYAVGDLDPSRAAIG